MTDIQYLSVEDVLRIRDQVAAAEHDTFEILRFQQLLSALATPFQSLFGEEIFPTLCAKAGMLLTGIVRNHPFWDGNKRIALAITSEFLRRNGCTLDVSPAEAREFTTKLATNTASNDDARIWIEQHTQAHNQE